jgi:hypothetical protein
MPGGMVPASLDCFASLAMTGPESPGKFLLSDRVLAGRSWELSKVNEC